MTEAQRGSLSVAAASSMFFADNLIWIPLLSLFLPWLHHEGKLASGAAPRTPNLAFELSRTAFRQDFALSQGRRDAPPKQSSRRQVRHSLEVIVLQPCTR